MGNQKELDYSRLWKTLLKLGLKDNFSVIRREFFMVIARTGPRFYNKEALDGIIEKSNVFQNSESFKEIINTFINKDDKFKHYEYATSDGKLIIEYFANTTSPITKEFTKLVYDNDPSYENITGSCSSATLPNEDVNDLECKPTTIHLICIGEASDSITPESYPMIIKHELAHACLFNLLISIINPNRIDDRIPMSWTDEQIIDFKNDVIYLKESLCDNRCIEFEEFVADFLMYESDGQIKVRNPVIEVKNNKKEKNDIKPKVTYRNVTPLERYLEVLDTGDKEHLKTFDDIIRSIRPCYDDYEKFVDEVTM